MLVSRWCYQSSPLKVISQQSLMVLAGRLVQSFSSSLVGFNLSIVSRIHLLEVRLSVSFSDLWISRL